MIYITPFCALVNAWRSPAFTFRINQRVLETDEGWDGAAFLPFVLASDIVSNLLTRIESRRKETTNVKL